MSDYVEKDGYGSLFNNERKEKDSHPDRRGTFTMGGKQYEIAGWLKDGKNGEFLSLKVQEARERPASKDLARERPASQDLGGGPLDDSIPF